MGARRADTLPYLLGLEKLGIKFGLDNIRAIGAALAHPEAAWPSVIVAGTNGKGSVAAMVEAALRAAGLHTGLYTSPHLVRLEERFALDGAPVGTEPFLEAAEEVRGAVERLRASGQLATDPTFFEVTTAVGFELFRRTRRDVVVLEVGLGGRFDATNVARPLAGAITTIDMDHERFLGGTIAAIAAEKAGIVKPGLRLVVGETKADAVAVIAAACREGGATMVPAREGAELSVRADGDRLVLQLATPRRRYRPIALALRGRHQADNALVAVRLLEELEEAGMPLDAGTIASGLETARWPGRLELRTAGAGREVLLDGAHNPAGAAVLANYLREFQPAGLPLVFGIMRDKQVAGTLAPLLPFAAPLVLTRARTERSLPLGDLEHAARALGLADVRCAADAEAALALAWTFARRVLVAGSLFLVGDVLASLDPPPHVVGSSPSG